jgi:hypothetical protein
MACPHLDVRRRLMVGGVRSSGKAHGIAGGGPEEGPQPAELMLRSRSNTLVSVRRVTERNAGRLTAGVDGEVVLTPEANKAGRQGAAERGAVQGAARQARVHPQEGQQRQTQPARNPRHSRQVPSGTGRQCAGARVGEARFEPKSYGFRPRDSRAGVVNGRR